MFTCRFVMEQFYCVLWRKKCICDDVRILYIVIHVFIQLPALGKNLGKRHFKPHLELFFDPIFEALVRSKIYVWSPIYLSLCLSSCIFYYFIHFLVLPFSLTAYFLLLSTCYVSTTKLTYNFLAKPMIYALEMIIE